MIKQDQEHHNHHHQNHQLLTVELGHKGSSTELNVLAFDLLQVYLYVIMIMMIFMMIIISISII